MKASTQITEGYAWQRKSNNTWLSITATGHIGVRIKHSRTFANATVASVFPIKNSYAIKPENYNKVKVHKIVTMLTTANVEIR